MSAIWELGPRIAGAARIAVEKVNDNKTLLPDHLLSFTWADSGCSSQRALAALWYTMGTLLDGSDGPSSGFNAVIGPGCSEACEVTSYLAGGLSTGGIPQISYGCSAPSLSNKTKHQLFSRTAPSYTGQGPVLIKFMSHYSWRKAVLLTSIDEVYFQSGLNISAQLRDAGKEVLRPCP